MIAHSFWFIVPDKVQYEELKNKLLQLTGWDYFKGFCVEASQVYFDYYHLYIHFTYPHMIPKDILTFGYLLKSECSNSLEQSKTSLRIWEISKEKVTIIDEITK